VKILRRAFVLALLLAFPFSDLASAAARGSHHARSYTASTGRTTHVKGYYRKDGTYVQPHERHASGSGSSYRQRDAPIGPMPPTITENATLAAGSSGAPAPRMSSSTSIHVPRRARRRGHAQAT
jgi:hypothetical protein